MEFGATLSYDMLISQEAARGLAVESRPADGLQKAGRAKQAQRENSDQRERCGQGRNGTSDGLNFVSCETRS